jgi:hypothetical protein
MGLRRYVCCFGQSLAKVNAEEEFNPKRQLERLHAWVMDFRMGTRPHQITQKEVRWLSQWKQQFEILCGRVRSAYGLVKVQEYTREFDRIYTQYVELLRESYRKNDLYVDSELLKTPAIRSMLGVSVRWYT